MAQVKRVPGDWGALAPAAPRTEAQIQEKARELLAQMSLAEKVHQMSGDTPFLAGSIEMARRYNQHPLPAGENPRLGVPGIRFSDGPRGVVMYSSTCFPVSMARGATWDTGLEERVGDAMGVEVRAQGANFFGGVCINLLRHPAWGRAQETYGEDPYHLGEMGAALVRGVQRHAMACVKHYACNSLENTRFKVDVRVDERTLQEIYLPHFKRCVDQGVAAVMSAYNQVNGAYCGHNGHLLRDILKAEWGFQGFVISDFLFGLRDAAAAAQAGLDVEMPFTWRFGRRLQRLVEEGSVPLAVIDEAVLRILGQKVRFAQVGEPERYELDAVAGPEHRALAREVAQKSMVLLKNDTVPGRSRPLLPIDRSRIRRLALIGRLVDAENLGDRGSSRVRPPAVVTPLQGIRAARGDVEVVADDGRSLERAAAVARQANVVVVVAGYTHKEEGEYVFFQGGDRDSLTLSRHDETLIQAVASANPHTAVVLVTGSAVVSEAWRDMVPAMLVAWYPGMEGGHALAGVLFGAVNPSGKLPCVFPRSAAHLPFFDRQARRIDYGFFHGYRLLDRDDYAPAFPFGFGLSYTTYTYRDLRLDQEEIGPDGAVRATVTVSNTGTRAGEEVVQLYVGYQGSRVERPVRDLKGFVRIALEPGESREVSFRLPAAQLAYFEGERRTWVVEPIAYSLQVGPSSRAVDLLHARFRVTG